MKYKRNFYEIKSNSQIFEKILIDKQSIGYFDLPNLDTSEIKKFAKGVRQENIFLLGMGGSSIGVRAIYNFLSPVRMNTKKIFFLDTIDPILIQEKISEVDIKNVFFIISSKSGNTVETISLLTYFSSIIEIDSSNSAVVSESDSLLSKYARKRKIKTFFIPHNVGGRFSVFSPVGLLPLSIVGINIDQLLLGARKVNNSFFSKGYYYQHIIKKARFLVENKSRFSINIIFAYSSLFRGFNDWFVQLWAESLGKKNINGTRQSLTPVGLIGPDDQHSFLQLLIDGIRDKTVTFIKIENFKSEIAISNDSLLGEFDLSIFGKMSLNKLINLQADSTIASIERQKDIPCDVLTIKTIDEVNIAKLMYRFQLMVSCVGAFLQINPYDQPGVEMGKTILKQKLDNQ